MDEYLSSLQQKAKAIN